MLGQDLGEVAVVAGDGQRAVRGGQFHLLERAAAERHWLDAEAALQLYQSPVVADVGFILGTVRPPFRRDGEGKRPGVLAVFAAVIAGNEVHLHRDGPALVLEAVEAVRRRQHQIGRNQRTGTVAADLPVDAAERGPWPDLDLDRRAVVVAFDADLPTL